MTLEGGAIDLGMWQNDRVDTIAHKEGIPTAHPHVTFADGCGDRADRRPQAQSLEVPLNSLVVEDGTRLAFKDWGSRGGQPILFSHGWPLSGDSWATQMLFFGMLGYRVIAHDRRGHGGSDQPWGGNNVDQFADDLAELIEALDLQDLILVGHSTGGGEIVRYMARHGTGRVAKVVLVSAVMPLMLQTENNPEGIPVEVFYGWRKGVAEDRPHFFHSLASLFYGAGTTNTSVDAGNVLCEYFWRVSMSGSIKTQYDCIQACWEADYTEDLRAIDKPTLVIHGDADQLAPLASSALRTVSLLRSARLEVYPGAPHGLPETDAQKLNEDVLRFVKE